MPKILLVEDNELNRDMLSRRLKRRGFDVLIAVDGGEGVSMATSELPDLILMDMSLPVMNGWQATKTLKAGAQTASIPIIALTAHAMVGDRDEAMAAGCDDYDTKPVDLKRLLQKIDAQLQATQGQPEKSVATVVTEPKQSVNASVSASSETLIAVSTNTAQAEQSVATAPVAESSAQQTTPLHQNSPATPSSQQPLSNNTSLKLLVVDDIEANRDMLGRRLERKGYEVVLADSGESALQVIATTDIALVLLDIMMPGIGGMETLKQIRQTHSQAQLPVIMATAKDTSEDIIAALELGANDYITKPIDLPIALARIQTHLNTREASEASQQQIVQSVASASPQLVSASFWDERYRSVEVLSKNPFGQTVIAQDLQEPDTPLRLIHTFRLDTNNPEILQVVHEILLTEVAMLRQIKFHEQCLPFLSLLQDGEVFYMIHEYVEGTLLSKVLETTTPLPHRNVCKIADDLLTIVDFLHQSHIIHTHPHPSCFLQPTQKQQKLMIIDYGITSRLLRKLSQKYPQYQQALQFQENTGAPELKAGNFTVQTDLFTVGDTLLQGLQTPAHSSEDYLAVLKETTQILQTMCQPQPENRYPSAYDARQAVRQHWHKLWKVELSIKSKQTSQV